MVKMWEGASLLPHWIATHQVDRVLAPCFCIYAVNDHRNRPGLALSSIHNHKIEVSPCVK